MKKNNLFLLAFVVFIFICLIVHCFWEYPQWSAIVAAITSASWLFAFADLFYSNHKFAVSITETYADYPETSIESLHRIKRAVDVRLSQSENFSGTNPLYTKQDEIDYYSSVALQVESLEKDFKTLKEKVNKEKRSANWNRLASYAFTVLGFLVLLCILVFEPVANFFVGMQDYMTVGAFGVILATQFCEGMNEDALAKMKDSIKNNFNALEALRKNFEDEVKHNLDS